MCHNVGNMWPQTTLLPPVWPWDAKRLDTLGPIHSFSDWKTEDQRDKWLAQTLWLCKCGLGATNKVSSFLAQHFFYYSILSLCFSTSFSNRRQATCIIGHLCFLDFVNQALVSSMGLAAVTLCPLGMIDWNRGFPTDCGHSSSAVQYARVAAVRCVSALLCTWYKFVMWNTLVIIIEIIADKFRRLRRAEGQGEKTHGSRGGEKSITLGLVLPCC